jgi:putative addiction module component (TIGR02574 family)
MSHFQDILAHASQLSVDERLRLIDELAASVPDNQPPRLSPEWLVEINRRSDEVDTGKVEPENWSTIRDRLFSEHGVQDAS